MRYYKFRFRFCGGYTEVSAMGYKDAEILAKAEALKHGWEYENILEWRFV